MGSTPFVIGLLAVAVIAVAWKVFSGGVGDAKWVVTVTGEGPEGIHVKGQVSGYSEGEVADFLGKLELPRGAKVWGAPDGARIRLGFKDVPEHLHQRLRNFFYMPH